MLEKALDSDHPHLKKRLVLPPMATQRSVDGKPGEELIAHYVRYGMNPAIGLIITEHSFIDHQGKADPYTHHRGLARVTNWVRLKHAAMNLKKLANWSWHNSFFCEISLAFFQNITYSTCFAGFQVVL